MRRETRTPIRITAAVQTANGNVKVSLEQMIQAIYDGYVEGLGWKSSTKREFDPRPRHMTFFIKPTDFEWLKGRLAEAGDNARIRAKVTLNPQWDTQTPANRRNADGSLGEAYVTNKTGRPVYINHGLEFEPLVDTIDLEGEGFCPESVYLSQLAQPATHLNMPVAQAVQAQPQVQQAPQVQQQLAALQSAAATPQAVPVI